MLNNYLIIVFIILFSFIGCVTPVSSQVKTAKTDRSKYLYDTIIMDIACVNSDVPSAPALDFLADTIKQYKIAKRIITLQREGLSGSRNIWALHDVQEFEAVNRKHFERNPTDRILVIFISYLDGFYMNGTVSNIAGVQYAPTSFAVFRRLTDDEWEGVVLVHEFCHMLEIAKAGNRRVAPINPDRPNHCNDENCTMYWRAGTHRTKLCQICMFEVRKLIRGEPLQRSRLYITRSH